MKKGYHRSFWQHAFNFAVKDREIDIPEGKLGVGDAEEYDSHMIPLHYEPVNRTSVDGQKSLREYDNMIEDRTASPLSQDDFPAEGYMGEALE